MSFADVIRMIYQITDYIIIIAFERLLRLIMGNKKMTQCNSVHCYNTILTIVENKAPFLESPKYFCYFFPSLFFDPLRPYGNVFFSPGNVYLDQIEFYTKEKMSVFVFYNCLPKEKINEQKIKITKFKYILCTVILRLLVLASTFV
uniref:Uncharacterized protein n=1 Tax=Cacopsylla melanoneura TaxID=428564 RepID=A0A8D9F818_9HEMI